MLVCSLILVLTCSSFLAFGHPQCLDFKPPFNSSTSDEFELCGSYQFFGCCHGKRVKEIASTYSRLIRSNTITPGCRKILADLLCQECSPYSAHIYNAEDSPTAPSTFPALCRSYCIDVMTTCSSVISLITKDEKLIKLVNDADVLEFCEAVEAPDVDYCYPDLLTNPLLNQNLGSINSDNAGTCDRFCVKEMAKYLYNPITLKHAKDGSHRVFVGEQQGIVWVYDHEFNKFEEPFLDISENVITTKYGYDERGFLDIEFHPQFLTNGRFFVYYSFRKSNGLDAVTINEMSVCNDNLSIANISTEKTLLVIDQPASNHNGGQLLFGDDGYLYIFTGDGGGKGDPWGKRGNGQNRKTYLGKVLRIDVDDQSDGKNYGIPRDNPFVDDQNYLPEIYAFGVRNMWRCSKDRGDENGVGKGRIICGDVGQNKYEEIDVIKKGANYGWRAFEGNHCYDQTICNDNPEQYTRPVYDYPHADGKSVTGGYFYRGCESPNLRGKYIFGDFFVGAMFSLHDGSERWSRRNLCLGGSDVCVNGELQSSYSRYILSFGEDELGELYFMASSTALPGHNTGSVYKIIEPSKRGNPETCQRIITRNVTSEIAGATAMEDDIHEISEPSHTPAPPTTTTAQTPRYWQRKTIEELKREFLQRILLRRKKILGQSAK